MNLICPNCKTYLVEIYYCIYCPNDSCNCRSIYYINNLCYSIRYHFATNQIIFDNFKKLNINEIELANKLIKENKKDIQYFFDTAYNICKKYEENLIFL